MQVQKRKEKSEKKIMQEYTRKKNKESEKLHTSIKETKVFLYQEKCLKFRSEHSINIA